MTSLDELQVVAQEVTYHQKHHQPGSTGTSNEPVAQKSQPPSAGGAPASGGPTVGLAGALMEGDLSKLQKKKKDWEDKYCALACRSRDVVGGDGEGVDFAYVIEVYSSRQAAAGGTNAEDRIYVMNSVVNFVQGAMTLSCAHTQVQMCMY